ncbi:MAG TPA: hypothetical protein PK509_11420 [Catalimonadaceae bacterium]|nr:hypothetical protein [Catalimonadaceae bacterium]
MKFLAILFSAYILLLNCIPCSDQENCNDKKEEQALHVTTDHSDHHHEADFCTPFCTCSCCGQTCKVSSFYMPTEPAFTTLTTEVPAFQPSTFHEVFLPIWQPPKLA